jgi:hypothetical protein
MVGSFEQLTHWEKDFIKFFFEHNLILTLGNFILLVPFSKWVEKQSLSKEILLYQERGEFTELNINLWIERIENSTGFKLNSTRLKVNDFIKKARRVKSSPTIYKKVISEIIFKKAFGNKPIKESFSRMNKKTKGLIYGSLIQIFASLALSISYSMNTMEKISEAIASGTMISLSIGSLYWVIAHALRSLVITYIVKRVVKKNGHGGYWHIVTAQLEGFKFMWLPFIRMPQRAMMKMTELKIENGGTKIVFNE